MKSFFTSATSPPSAESTPGVVGTRTEGMPSSRASRQAVIGPPPPKASRLNSRRSTPWCAASLLTSRYIPDTATWITASAAERRSRPSAFAIGSIAASAFARSTVTAL